MFLELLAIESELTLTSGVEKNNRDPIIRLKDPGGQLISKFWPEIISTVVSLSQQIHPVVIFLNPKCIIGIDIFSI